MTTQENVNEDERGSARSIVIQSSSLALLYAYEREKIKPCGVVTDEREEKEGEEEEEEAQERESKKKEIQAAVFKLSSPFVFLTS